MKSLLLCLTLLCVLMFGCGSQNSGSLSVSSPSASNGIVTVTATYTPSTGLALSGQTISFRWYTVGVTSKSQSSELATSGTTDSSGAVTSQFILPAIRSESLVVYVIASTGDLTNKEGWQSIVVAP